MKVLRTAAVALILFLAARAAAANSMIGCCDPQNVLTKAGLRV